MKIKITIIFLLSLITAQAFASRFVISFNKKNDKFECRVNGHKYKFSELVKILNKIDKDLYVYIDVEMGFPKEALYKILKVLKQNKVKKAFLVFLVRNEEEVKHIEIPINLKELKFTEGLEKIPIPPEPPSEEEVQKEPNK